MKKLVVVSLFIGSAIAQDQFIEVNNQSIDDQPCTVTEPISKKTKEQPTQEAPQETASYNVHIYNQSTDDQPCTVTEPISKKTKEQTTQEEPQRTLSYDVQINNQSIDEQPCTVVEQKAPIQEQPTNDTVQQSTSSDTAILLCIAAYLQRTLDNWAMMSEEEQQKKIQEFQADEQTFNELVAILKNKNCNQVACFKETFKKLNNKNHKEEGGTILAAIISFVEGDIAEQLIAYALQEGVTTDRLPGEFVNNKYFSDKAPITDKVVNQVKKTYNKVKDTVQDKVSDIKEKVVDISEKVADKFTSKKSDVVEQQKETPAQ